MGGLSSGLYIGLVFGLFFGLTVLIGWLILGLSSGLGSSEIVQRIVPNQGIRSSWRNCLIIGLSLWLLLGLEIFRLLNNLTGELSLALIGGLGFGLGFGLIVGLVCGGAACIQHFTLRQMLYQKKRIPWNYAKFLDFASDRLLMKKVGGGYIFFHRMLLEHFAQKEGVSNR